MISVYRKLYNFLNYRERCRFYLLTILMIITGILDTIGIASILPFLAAASKPQHLEENELLSTLYNWGNFNSDQSFLIFLGCLVLFLVLLGLAAKIVTTFAISRFARMRNHSIGSRLLAAYLHQPYAWFLNHHSAELGKNVLYEVELIIMEALLPALRIISHIVSVICLVLLLMVVQPWIAIFSAIVIGGAYFVIFSAVRAKLTRLGELRVSDNSARHKMAQEAISGIKDVKLLGLEEAYIDRFSIPSRRTARNASVSQVIGELPRHLLEVVAFGGMILLILILLITGSGSIGDIIPTLGVFAFAGLRMFPAMQQIYNAIAQMRFVQPILNSVHKDFIEMNAGKNLYGKIGRGSKMPFDRFLEMRDVHYSYPSAEKPALNGLSLKIEAKTTVGIVGGSGAGKTTAVDVILGLLPIDSGCISVDGTLLDKNNLRAWQDTLGYVPQHIYLLDDSVQANIAFGVPPEKVDVAAVESAARIANLHEFVVKELPLGYDTPIGERGARLSGGQRQRIGIARALYHSPEVIIFDEATSALDNLTERAVMSAVHKLANSKTIIIIAHRLSTVRNCDVIYLLEGGRKAAQGTYDDLAQKNETFRQMVKDLK